MFICACSDNAIVDYRTVVHFNSLVECDMTRRTLFTIIQKQKVY